MPWQSPCPPPSWTAFSRRGILRHGRWGPGTSICQKNDLKALSCQPKWDNLHISHWRMQIYFMLWDELFSRQDIHLLGVRRGPRPPPSDPENISIMSRRKKLSNAENLFTLLLCCWWLAECESDIRSIWESKIKLFYSFSLLFLPPNSFNFLPQSVFDILH